MTWKTVRKSSLSGRHNDFEYEAIERLHGAIPPYVTVTLLADRGFGDQKLYALLASLGWDYVIRFRGAMLVEDDSVTQKPAETWVPKSGRPMRIKPAGVTNDRALVPAVVVVHQAKVKEPWCLATSLAEKTAAEIVALYAKRSNASRSRRRSATPRIFASGWG